MIETKTLLNKLSKGGCFCNLCNQRVTIDDTENVEYVKSKASGENWYDTSCIKRYRTLEAEEKQTVKKEDLKQQKYFRIGGEYERDFKENY